jgi:succinate dehydrogenase / fumarate reductase, cytochrome b subunit
MLTVSWLRSSLGQKYIMAVTGLGFLGFVIAHLLGNLLIFAGPDAINTYAEKLKDLGPGLWVLRACLLFIVVLHIWTSVNVSIQNRRARVSRYRGYKTNQTTSAARTMIFSGLLLTAFIVYHLLHFTFHIADSSIAHHADAAGRHDVYTMMVLGFQNPLVSGVYIVAMLLLCAHLHHGFQSSFQSLGLNNDRLIPVYQWTGRIVAMAIFIGYVSIPAAVLLGRVHVHGAH